MRAALDGGAVAVTHHVIQGEQKVTEDPRDVLATLLGSCVAACLHDPVAGVGGMNHFLLPGDSGAGGRAYAERFGVHAMELLVNALLGRGALRSRLEAKLFGGASTMQGLSDIGSLNASFAKGFLQRENIRITSECLGGERGRRIQFWPVTGRARRSFMGAAEPVPPPRPARVVPSAGALELF
ncbi:chemotaxis protein CheD [Lichenibacterium ramalinae]|uniref:Probable chemoreceptor glutamine deamidase CheD n=1 Tax=Lichenibacterium ramalinae TaxID=2316527 RepID=A0A4Q2R8M2_9HYPH|nr:chemotaxis protein CheD [Lichenibacterium ramalinae]RYB03069.1 chemotaxis protein CheD [Lichenibacterium ramalinae]